MKRSFVFVLSFGLLAAGQHSFAQGIRLKGVTDFEVLTLTSAVAECVALHTPATIDESREGIRPFVRNAGLDAARIEQIRNEYGTSQIERTVQGFIDENGCKELIPESAYERYGPYKPLGNYRFDR